MFSLVAIIINLSKDTCRAINGLTVSKVTNLLILYLGIITILPVVFLLLSLGI